MNPFHFVLIILGGIVALFIGFYLQVSYPINSWLLIVLTVGYFLSASIVTFDMRLIQARFQGDDFGVLPSWTVIFHYSQWGLFIGIAILNWKYALSLFFLKFIFKVLPVLETVGNVLTSPLKNTSR